MTQALLSLAREWDALTAEVRPKVIAVENILDQLHAVNREDAYREALFRVPPEIVANLRSKITSTVVIDLREVESYLPKFEGICRRVEAVVGEKLSGNEDAYVLCRYFRSSAARRKFACKRAERLLDENFAVEDVRVLRGAFDDSNSRIPRTKVDGFLGLLKICGENDIDL